MSSPTVPDSKQTVGTPQPPIFGLPNEILLSMLNMLPTRTLLPLIPTCRHFHSLILRLLHNRLQIAAGLAGYTFFLECHHPSARLIATTLFCNSLGTDGLDLLVAPDDNDASYVEKARALSRLHSRFKPRRREAETRPPRRHPAGDVPGSRTHPGSTPAQAAEDKGSVVETVTVDAHDLFTQLSTSSYLGKRSTRGLLSTVQDITEGTIRVWRDWLSKQCESRTWSNEDAVPIVRDDRQSSASAQAGNNVDLHDPAKDPAVLWVNTRDNSLGIKFKVKERKWRRTATPLIYNSDVEIAASYEVKFEEVYVKTMHLLFKLEEAERQLDNHSGKAIVFRSFGTASGI